MEVLSTTNKQIIKDLYTQVWCQGDCEAIDRFYAPGELCESLKQFARNLFAGFPDWKVTINEMVEEGDKIAIYWTGRGTHEGEWLGIAPTGKFVSVDGLDLDQFSNGMIIKEDGIPDMLGMMRQLKGKEES